MQPTQTGSEFPLFMESALGIVGFLLLIILF
jgi:hypothetical protein